MKYLNTYTAFSKDMKTFENFTLNSTDNLMQFLDLIEEGKFQSFLIKTKNKFSDWAIKAPKIRKFQEKANAERILAAEARVKFRKESEAAVMAGSKVDIARLKQTMDKKVAIHYKLANIHEEEATKIADGNPYLMKVQDIVKYNGKLKENEILLQKALDEEQYELDDENAAYRKKIEIDTDEVNAKIEYDKNPKGKPEPIPSQTNLKDDIISKIQKKGNIVDAGGLTPQEQDDLNVAATAWIKHITHQLLAHREGKDLRESPVPAYKIVDAATELVLKKNMDIGTAVEKVTKQMIRDGKYNPTDKKGNAFKRKQ